MSISIFPYVGGKSELSTWILEYLPDHKCYVEPFSGSASVFLAKPRSKVEVINDLDGDIVHFFKIVRDRPDELQEYIQNIPYSRQLYNEWADEYFAGKRVDDPIERAARWVFLRYSSFGGKYGRKSGFKRASHLNQRGPAKIWSQVPDRVEYCRDRLQGVTIECKDALELIELYDGPDTVFYCDPPYIEAETDYYSTGPFDHTEFESLLSSIQENVLVSYGQLPIAFETDWIVLDRDYTQRARRGSTGEWRQDAIERLCLNFNPESTASFVDATHRQQTLSLTGNAGDRA